MRVGASLPLLGTDVVETIDQSLAPSPDSQRGSRWLVLVKANGDALRLSLCKPSFGALSNQYSHAFGEDTKWNTEYSSEWNRSGSSEREMKKAKKRLQRVVFHVTWRDWAELGYGPLQWMSHAQKTLLGALALSWVSFGTTEKSSLVTGEGDLEAFLQIRPTLASVRRIVGISPNFVGPAAAVGDNGGIMGRVAIRDEGHVFGVEVEIQGQDLSPCRRLSRSFGKETWEETGLGDLLWMAWKWRRYVASRLSRQVAAWETGLKNEGKKRVDFSRSRHP